MFGLPPVAALAISTNVERAVDRHLRRAGPLVAGRARVGAQLEAIRERLPALTTTARDIAQLEEILAHASARIEEWAVDHDPPRDAP
jgi:hypothetical protein